MRQRIKATIIAIALVVSAGLTLSPAGVSALETGDYSCGAYGGGDYSEGASCSNNDNIKPPNTGFAERLAQPSTLIPLVGSALVLSLGVAMLLKKRSHKKH